MAKEIELKFLDVNPIQVRTCFENAGAVLEHPLYSQIRYVFDITPNDESQWLRLRTQNGVTTLTYKKINSSDSSDVEEHEVEVNDEAQTLQILNKLGLEPKAVQETYRETYSLDGAELSIDFWPMLKPYVEVEAPSLDRLKKVVSQLGFIASKGSTENTLMLYKSAGIDLSQIPELRFTKEETITIEKLRLKAKA